MLVKCVVIQLLSCVRLFATPCTAALQASLAFTISWSLLKLMAIELVKPSNHLILCCSLLLPPLISPASGSFQMSQLFASFSSVQFSSVGQSCPTPCDPMNCSTPELPVHDQLLESTQTHIHRVSDAIQPSHPLSSPSPSTFNLSQHQGPFK